MLQVSIRISGTSEEIARLQKLGRSFLANEHLMKVIGEDVSDYYANRGFLSQGGVFKETWSPIKRSYALWKSKHYPGAPPLVRTGKMRRSFRARYSQDSVVIENTAPYFKYHQSSLPRKKLPRRQMMGINSAVREIVRLRVKAEVSRKIKEAGL
jgi:phage gpG-like protein